MKKVFLFAALVFAVTQLSAKTEEENRNFRIPLIGEKAPSFTAESTAGTINFPSDFGRNWKILFSHPQDFTPVCSSEILELANLQNEFDKLGAKLVVLSTDPLATHVQWKKALEELDYKGRTPVKIKFPLVDDEQLSVSKMYGMIHSSSNTTKSVRGVFIVDPNNVVQAIYFYPDNVGRSTEELLRTVLALKTASKENVLTPSDWKAGNDVLLPYLPKTDDKKTTENKDNFYNVSWFMIYKKSTM
ncbi:MAG: peroxiredoxin [Bacteroidales bacterium]|nr:peroxiredoxin [Bacteroidales bacterium]